MSRRNREKRAAKRRGRCSDGAECSGGGGTPQREVVEEALRSAMVAYELGHVEELDHAVDLIDGAAASPGGARVVGRLLDEALERVVSDAWQRGWQPADLSRLVTKELGSRHDRLVVDAIAADATRYAEATVAPRWRAPLAEIGGGGWWQQPETHFEQWVSREASGWFEAVAVAIELLARVRRLETLPRLCDLPGEAHGAEAGRGGAGRDAKRSAAQVDPGMLARVRALLAKAESTSFPEEAEAFTAKAQEMMTRHEIDRAMLDEGKVRGEAPQGVRVGIDDPYADAKSLLLSGIAGANSCQAVWTKRLGFATVFGFSGSIEAVELLYTSLLVQATSTLNLLAKQPGDHSRSRSFRRSFLVAFAHRIGERLREASAATTSAADADHGGRLLPVLAARDREVGAARDAAFPNVEYKSYSVSSTQGWVAGRAAADTASLWGSRALTPQ